MTFGPCVTKLDGDEKDILSVLNQFYEGKIRR